MKVGLVYVSSVRIFCKAWFGVEGQTYYVFTRSAVVVVDIV